jgi:hypothetical protein
MDWDDELVSGYYDTLHHVFKLPGQNGLVRSGLVLKEGRWRSDME